MCVRPALGLERNVFGEASVGSAVTLAHIIANPDPSLFKKLGVLGERSGALGIMTITPSEGAIIGADVATKHGSVEVVFVDRFNGSLIINGDVADVESAIRAVMHVLSDNMHFAGVNITKT